MKLRKFEIDNGKLVVSDKGEWVHENDVLLMLQNSRDEINGMISYSKDAFAANPEDDWMKKQAQVYEDELKLVERLIHSVKFGNF
jgi:hypothetical protein